MISDDDSLMAAGSYSLCSTLRSVRTRTNDTVFGSDVGTTYGALTKPTNDMRFGLRLAFHGDGKTRTEANQTKIRQSESELES